jgi:hypothetical protein
LRQLACPSIWRAKWAILQGAHEPTPTTDQRECVKQKNKMASLFQKQSSVQPISWHSGTYQESCLLGVLELSTFLKLTSI